MKRTVLFILLFLPQIAHGQLWSGVLSSSRAIDWTPNTKGVQGGIPSASWTQCGSTIAAYGTSSSPGSPATIQSAVDACGANTYLQLGAGSFYLSGSIQVCSKHNFEIRGLGANTTFIYSYGLTAVENCQDSGDQCGGLDAIICFIGDYNDTGTQANGPVNWTAGYSQGTSVITLASVPNLVIGNPIILDQLLDTIDTGTWFEQIATTGGNPYTSPGLPGPYTYNGGPVRAGRGLTHVYIVAGCNGSTTIGTACSGTNVAVTITPALEEPNWNSALSPQAWWASSPSTYVGVQNLAIDGANDGCGANNSYGIAFWNAANVWEQGVRDTNECYEHVGITESARATIRNNYFFLARFAATSSYGVGMYASSDSLIENNIAQAIAGAFITNEGTVGNVIDYNFEINGYYSVTGAFVIPMMNYHGVASDLGLLEGNIGSRLDADTVHGTGNAGTMFRNYASGMNVVCWESTTGPGGDYASYLESTWGTCTNSVYPIQVDPFHRFFNIIGNVLGTTGVTTNYQTNSSQTIGNDVVYFLGQSYQGDIPPTYDTTVVQTLYRWGNCDNTNGGNGGTAFTACQFNSAEVPVTANLATSQQPYAQFVPSNHTLPASFIYSSKPSWWPSGKPWPIIGPDVSGGNISGVNGEVYTNPAEDCYNSLSGSTSNGTGGPFPFSASACYGNSSSSPNAAPLAGYEMAE